MGIEIGTILVIILLIALVAYVITIFNKIVKASNLNYEAFSNVDVVLKERFDLIPNLEEVVKGYTNHEKTTLEDISRIRTELSEKMTVSDRQKAEDRFSAVFKDIFTSVENYPDLKASHNFLALQTALIKIEEDIEMARRNYNGTTRNFNALIQKFPNNILSSILGYHKRAFFEVDLLTRENVQINFPDRRKESRDKEWIKIICVSKG